MKRDLIIVLSAAILAFLFIGAPIIFAKNQIRKICTYSLNAYPQDSITYYRLGCEIEYF